MLLTANPSAVSATYAGFAYSADIFTVQYCELSAMSVLLCVLYACVIVKSISGSVQTSGTSLQQNDVEIGWLYASIDRKYVAISLCHAACAALSKPVVTSTSLKNSHAKTEVE